MKKETEKEKEEKKEEKEENVTGAPASETNDLPAGDPEPTVHNATKMVTPVVINSIAEPVRFPPRRPKVGEMVFYRVDEGSFCPMMVQKVFEDRIEGRLFLSDWNQEKALYRRGTISLISLGGLSFLARDVFYGDKIGQWKFE